jgi:hypothetical protein
VVGSDFGWNLFKAVRSVGKTVAGGVSSVGKQLDKVPVVGKGLHAVYSVTTGPLELAAHITSGQRLDHAAIGAFKGQLTAARDIAPYAQTVVSMVPGIGSGVSAGIAAASVLAQGRPISEAMIEAAKSALPGGPLAKAAFDATVAVAQGKSITDVGLAAIPLPDNQKEILRQSLAVAKDIADGKRVDHILLDRVNDNLKLLPAGVQQAAQVGVALGYGKNIQTAMKEAASPESLMKLVEVGKGKIGSDNVLSAGFAHLKDLETKQGFHVGAGMSHFKFSPTELNAIRGKLAPKAKEGFDIAMSTHVGKLLKQLPAHLDPKVKFGYYASLGMRNAKQDNQVVMKKTLGTDPKVSHGMLGAKQTIIKEKDLKHLGFWQRVKYLLVGR